MEWSVDKVSLFTQHQIEAEGDNNWVYKNKKKNIMSEHKFVTGTMINYNFILG